MTAVVAYAGLGCAFAAADTKRISCFTPVNKIHLWGTGLIIGQAGNSTHLTLLLGHMNAVIGIYGDDFSGLFGAFSAFRSHYHAQATQAVKHNSNAVSGGTLLVSDAYTGELTEIDFATGSMSKINTQISGIGVSQAKANAIAAWGSGRNDLAEWAVECIDPLKIDPSVDWPIDIFIVRPSNTGGTLAIRRRLPSLTAATVGDAVFHIEGDQRSDMER